jgi:vancomycin aglycone glucosyltransferase
MKVLLAPLGSRGDVQPQLVLGEELVRRGHTVTLAASPNFRPWAESRGFAFIPVGEDINVIIRQNSHMTEQHPVVALPGQIRLVRRHLAEQARDLFAAPHEHDIVVAAGLSLVAKMLADSLGVPHVFCCYTLSMMCSAAHAPALTPVFGLPRFANRALWRAITTTFELTLGGPLNDLRRARGLPPYASSWRAIHGTQVLLAQDNVMGELPSDLPGENHHVPALVPRPERAAPLPEALEGFLRDTRPGLPVVYLGFGSMPSVDRAHVVDVARELVERYGARVLLHSSHGEETGVELPPGVLSVGDVDHQTLFPRVDLIVHHGGAGTTAAALRSGAPQLVVPHIVDQFFHGRRLAELGVAPAPVPKAELRSKAVAAALADRAKYRAKALLVRAQLEQEGGAAQAACYLETLARHPR